MFVTAPALLVVHSKYVRYLVRASAAPFAVHMRSTQMGAVYGIIRILQ